MKTVNVSESALDSIKSMAIEREREIIKLHDVLWEIRNIARNNARNHNQAWELVKTLCNEALSG